MIQNIRNILILLSCIFSACTNVNHTESKEYLKDSCELGFSSEVCPYGHQSVRYIPIMYGLPNLTKELKKKIKKQEIVLGGCIVGSEEFKTRCIECGFTKYDNEWELREEREEVFHPQLPVYLSNIRLRKRENRFYYSHIFKEGEEDYFSKTFHFTNYDNPPCSPLELGFNVEYKIILDLKERQLLIGDLKIDQPLRIAYHWISRKEGYEFLLIQEDVFCVLEVAPIGKNKFSNTIINPIEEKSNIENPNKTPCQQGLEADAIVHGNFQNEPNKYLTSTKKSILVE